MKAKDKAENLVKQFSPCCAGNSQTLLNLELAKKCALICVDELLILANLMDGGFSFDKEIDFLGEVKQEILAL